MAIVYTNADEEWKVIAGQIVNEIALRQPFLTSLDVLRELERRPDISTHELRAIGPIMARAAKDGTITHHEIIRRNDKHHRGASVKWKSLIYRPEIGRDA